MYREERPSRLAGPRPRDSACRRRPSSDFHAAPPRRSAQPAPEQRAGSPCSPEILLLLSLHLTSIAALLALHSLGRRELREKSQRSRPRSGASSSTRATPALASLIRPLVRAATVREKSSSCPTSMRHLPPYCFCKRASPAMPKPGASSFSSTHFIPRCSVAISAVCAARGSGLVRIKSGAAFSLTRSCATAHTSSRPASVSGRSSSSFCQSGQSAFPCLRKYNFIPGNFTRLPRAARAGNSSIPSPAG